MDFVQTIIAWFYWHFRPLIKWFLHQTTRLCELQRICYGETPGAPRSIAVESSLYLSRSPEIRELRLCLDDVITRDEKSQKVLIDEAVNRIIAVKKIKKDLHIQFVYSMRSCLRQIWGYKRMQAEVEALRATAYDSDNLQHERSLLELWSLLQPGVPLETRKTKQWQNIGFQGEDPKTDFRGMGMLGLENLLYFAREYNTAAKHILSHSHHPKHGYSFAIVGINLTHMAYRLLTDGSAKSHIFNASLSATQPELRHFHHFYSYLFIEFDRFWLSEKPKDIMEFNRIRDLFENNIRNLLADSRTCFKINITVDTV